LDTFHRGLALGVLLLVFAGCARSSVQTHQETHGKLPRPDTVLVYDFAVTPDEIMLDTGLSAELRRYYSEHTGTPLSAQEIKIGHQVADAVADELVQQIRGYGLQAERALGKPPARGRTLMVKGQFVSIDEGNRTERVAIGFGSGRTSVEANVQVYNLTPEGLKQVETMQASSESGGKPGMGVLMGAGALAGHLLASTLVSGTLSTAGELSFQTVQADAKRLAGKVAAELGQFFVQQGWIAPEAVKSSLF
jgi:hypothetical protein